MPGDTIAQNYDRLTTVRERAKRGHREIDPESERERERDRESERADLALISVAVHAFEFLLS